MIPVYTKAFRVGIILRKPARRAAAWSMFKRTLNPMKLLKWTGPVFSETYRNVAESANTKSVQYHIGGSTVNIILTNGIGEKTLYVYPLSEVARVKVEE